MKKTVVFLMVFFCLVVVAWAELNWGGYLSLDERFRVEDKYFSWNRSTINLKLKSSVAEQVEAFGEIRLRNLEGGTVNDLSLREKVSPWELDLREAYVDIRDFPLANVDLRAGKQRIAWGKADKFNPTDNLNPYDFSDLLEFGEKIPTNALRLTAYLGDNTLTAAVVPTFTPALMPYWYENYLENYLLSLLPPGFNLTTFESRVILPLSKIEESQYALKFSRPIAEADFSLSYYHGRDNIPNLAFLSLTPVGTTSLEGLLVQEFNRLEVLGCDLAGSWHGIGWWGEVGYFRPSDAKIIVVTPLATTTSETKPFTKYTLGVDYKFSSGLYVNCQLIHGFFDERGNDLKDYLLTRGEIITFEDRIKLAFTWLAEYDKKIVGNMFGPSITWYPADATEVTVGSLAISGESGTKLDQWNSLDQIYLKVKYSF